VPGSAREARSRRRLPLRTVASGKVEVPAAGTHKLKVKLARRYRTQLERTGRVKAQLHVEFRPASGGTRLTRTLTVAFTLQKGTKR
jgi:hypothetical protein